MPLTELVKKHTSICHLASAFQIADAFSLLETLIHNSRIDELMADYEACRLTYQNVLKYSMQGVQDPYREKIMNNLVIEIIELADKVKEHYSEAENTSLKERKIKAFQAFTQVQQKLYDALEADKLNERWKELLPDNTLDVMGQELESKMKQFRTDFFNYIVYADKLSDADILLIEKVYKLPQMQWFDKALLVSSVSLSLLRYFDSNKFNLLFLFQSDNHDEIKYRALVGIFSGFLTYNKRAVFYKSLHDKIIELYATSQIDETDLILLIKQWIRARNTDKIIKKLNDEILPDIQKMGPKISEKLNLDQLNADDLSSEKNPDWQHFFEDSPDLLGKIEEMSKMQLEGNDVFMSSFSQLKQFDFFKNLSNWFVPFYSDNLEFGNNMISADNKKSMQSFVSSLMKSTYMCNSDKYSFLLNLEMMPEQQRSMILSMFSAELESMNEVNADDELINVKIHIQTIFAQYVQDLYRFMKIHPARFEFDDVFLIPFDFQSNVFFNTLFPESEFLLKVADYLFQQEQYQDAMRIYIKLNTQGGLSMELLQKSGYCHQQLGLFHEALDFYYKAELFESDNSWNLKKIAYCLKRVNNYTKAIEYYHQIEKKEPENKNNMMNLANAYLIIKDYSKALHYYYKMEFTSSESVSLSRPIAWCLLLLKQIDRAKSYYDKIIESNEMNQHDWMHLGHLYLSEKKYKDAMDCYHNCLLYKENTKLNFIKSFEDDLPILKTLEVDHKIIQLALDNIKLNL